MAEITVESTDTETTAEAVEAALTTGYVILHDAEAGTATIVVEDIDDDELLCAVENAADLNVAGGE